MKFRKRGSMKQVKGEDSCLGLKRIPFPYQSILGLWAGGAQSVDKVTAFQSSLQLFFWSPLLSIEQQQKDDRPKAR